MSDLLHGVESFERASSLKPPRKVSMPPVVFGCAPVSKLTAAERAKGMPGQIALLQSFADAERIFGIEIDDDWEEYGLSEAAYSIFQLAAVKPALFVNLFDPDKHASPADVTSADCIKAIDLVSQVFPRYRLVSGPLAAPGFSEDPAVAAVLAAKTKKIGSIFEAGCAVVDIKSDGTGAPASCADVPAYKEAKGLSSPQMYALWSKALIGERAMRASSLALGVIGATDASTDGIPSRSPSNRVVLIQGALANGADLWLDLSQADFLNSNGITTLLNGPDGWTLWGNRTACFPGETDVAKNFVTHRRMFAFLSNELALSNWGRVDERITQRHIEGVVDSTNIRLNQLVADEHIVAGKCAFREEDNNVLGLGNGKSRFHFALACASPNEKIEFIIEHDLDLLKALSA